MRRRYINRFQAKQLRRRSWALGAWIAAGVAALCIVAALPVVSGRTAPRWYYLQSAKLSVDAARRAGAEHWNPSSLHQAERILRAGMAEHRHQEARFVLLRDFTDAEVLLRQAESQAQAAGRETLRQKGQARATAQDTITRAAQSVNKGDAFAQAMRLSGYDRTLLQRSKIALREAVLLHRQGEYRLASLRAQTAGVQAERVSDRAASAASRYVDSNLLRSWRRWIQDTIAWSRRTRQPVIVVYKDKHQLTLYDGGQPVRSYTAELGYGSIGNKLRSGDAATPEGRYHVAAKKPVGASAWHMALLLNYPNDEDRRRFEAARRAGRVARGAQMGGLIEIHGEGGRGKDWTKGCVALTNDDIGDLFDRVGVGTPVTIVGGDGNGGTYTKLIDLHRASSDAGMN